MVRTLHTRPVSVIHFFFLLLVASPWIEFSLEAAAARRTGRLYGVACQGGTFDLRPTQTERFVSNDGLVLSLVGLQASIVDVCPATKMVVRLSRRGTVVQAFWPYCSRFHSRASFVGTIDSATCNTIRGELRVASHAPILLQGGIIACTESDTVGGDDGTDNPPKCDDNQSASLKFSRWYDSFSQRASPAGFIPGNALNKGAGQIALMPIDLDRWFAIGPAPIDKKGEHLAGRVSAVAIDPGDEQHWLIGASSGGIWETSDSGGTWTPRTDNQKSLAISAIAFDPVQHNVVYAGTGGYSPEMSSVLPGAGLLKSTDGGATWTSLAESTFANLGFGRVQLSGFGSGVAATVSPDKQYFYDSHTPPTGSTPGVYLSSSDGSAWTLTLKGEATDIVTNPSFFQWQIAGLAKPPGLKSKTRSLLNVGIFRTFNSGQKWAKLTGPWTALSGGIGEVRFALSPSHPQTLYVSIRDANDGAGKDLHLLGLWKTTNAWDANPVWQEITGKDYAVGTMTHDILAHPTNPDVLYAAGVELWKYIEGEWLAISLADPSDPESAEVIHVDQNALAWAGPNLVVGNDGGVYSKDEIDDSPWIDSTGNLQIAQFRGGAVWSGNPDIMIGGAHDNGTALRSGLTTTWQRIGSGDGMQNFFGGSDNQMAITAQWGIVERSLDGGTSSNGALFGVPTTETDFNSFFTVITRCPANPNIVLYSGVLKIWGSTNFFSAADFHDISWTSKSDSALALLPGIVRTIAFAPSDTTCQTYAFGDQAGQIFITSNDGAKWIKVKPGPGRTITGLAFDFTDPSTLYATLSGFDEATPGQAGHVFETKNALDNSPAWVDISPPVDLPFDSIAVNPTIPGVLFAGSDMSLFTSNDDGMTWTHADPSHGLPNVPIIHIETDGCRTTVFTLGRGAFRTTALLCP